MRTKKTRTKARKTAKKTKNVMKKKVRRKAVRAVKKVRKAVRKAPKARKAPKKVTKAKRSTPARAPAGPPPLGKVVHYYDRIGVGIVELRRPLTLGARVRLKRGMDEFEQQVSSMQIDHQPVRKAKKGDVIGLKVDRPVHEGALVLPA